MELRWHIFTLYAVFFYCPALANNPPFLLKDMNNLALLESTPIGEVVYKLQGTDPDGSPVRYSLVGTDKFSVDAISGNVTLVKPLDRELEDSLKFLVKIEEDSDDPFRLSQEQPVTVIVLDENDNPPVFKNSPYEVDVPEDAEIGRTILHGIEVVDQDSVGLNLEVGCVPNAQWPEACDIFEVVTLQSSSDKYVGALVLRKPLNYNEKQFYQFQLYANDGTLNSSAHVEIKVEDVQNTPPAFSGALSGSINEDAAVGTLVLRVTARDGDRARPRPISVELLTNPLDFFILDSNTGELRTAKPLDREALDDPSSPLNITVRASEIVNGQPLISPLTSTTTVLTISIKDVNDSPPKFNKREYSATLPESLPPGTPLPNLDIVVTDADMGLNSVFALRLSDEMGAFVVEPSQASGSASVTLRLNTSLDYEDPNQRKFILEIIAEELHTTPRLSSKASVTITVVDVNDNAPHFSSEQFSSNVPEDSAAGSVVAVVTATDRDTERFGTAGIIYQLSGNGAHLFRVDNKSGVISVAPCVTPGHAPCLDYEDRKDYFLQYKAIDDEGKGQSTVVSLQISLVDANDNAPVFLTSVYKASIDEGASKFEPELQVQARDIDVSSDIRYSIISPADHPFWMDALTGKISVKPESNVVISGEDNNKIVLTVLATDGVHNATSLVEVTVRDVNNHAPAFDTDKYDADISEDAPIGTEVAAVRATDLDSGINAIIKYSIQKGAFDSFAIDNVTGVVTVSSKLDYDKRNVYRVEIAASDMGMPSLTGTTELTIHVINVNDKQPYFTPTIQRAEISADAALGSIVHDLIAVDPDIEDAGLLFFDKSKEREVQAVDKNGKEVSSSGIFDSWFSVLSNGSVTVTRALARSLAAVVTLPVTVTDTSASQQTADGDLIITIVDVNRQPPTFTHPAYIERIPEELPIGTKLNTYTATDDTPISAMLIQPENEYFNIDNVTGVVTIAKRIDYETLQSLNFTLVAIDSGVPQLSSSASVRVDVLNVNDETPTFDQAEYEATVVEHSGAGTVVVGVHAVDKDEGEFGEVTYSLSGEQSSLFNIDPYTGVITVSGLSDIDRETTSDIYIRAVATDHAPANVRKSTSVPIHIKIIDINDNPPTFTQKVYKSTIDENLSLHPPAPILQVLAEDRDEGGNGEVEYSITEQTVPGTFTINPSTGIIYPSTSVSGDSTHQLNVLATDGFHKAQARVDINVLRVNEHAPVFVEPPDKFEARVPENEAQAGYLITTVKATDKDSGENGRVSYYLKVDNQNVGETAEFSLDKVTGELRAKSFLDREIRQQYELVIAAVDNGSAIQRQTLRLLTVVLIDEDDNKPKFQHKEYNFSVMENLTPGVIIGTVKAIDKDSGDNGKVYYHILEGNRDGAVVLDRTQGVIKANISFDRETKSSYSLTIYASNNPLLENFCTNNCTEDESSVKVNINILDQNDNAPEFEKKVYYAGIKHTVRVNEPVLSLVAHDPDLDENGTLIYMVASSNLYKFGASQSSGSVVPSPFNISQDGLLTTASYMADYNQDRFVLELVAQEAAPPHRQARAQVYVWIIDRSSLIRMIVSKSCMTGSSGVLERVSSLSNTLLVSGKRLPLVHENSHSDWCEIHLHAVDPSSYQVLPVDQVLQTIDSKYDALKDAYRQYGVETLTAGAASKPPDHFDPALAALIALLIVLFTGIVTFVVVCACLKHWVIPPPSMQSSKGDSLSRRRILEELSTTENPLWLETKLRPYEEQELTMNVFGDQQEHNNVEAAPTDNTYATIPGRGDYATLGGESPTPLEAALGFQGSTFKPPSPHTPEPPPRPSAGLPLL